MGQIGCRETSVMNYHDMLRNIPEERRSLLLRGWSPKPRSCCELSSCCQPWRNGIFILKI